MAGNMYPEMSHNVPRVSQRVHSRFPGSQGDPRSVPDNKVPNNVTSGRKITKISKEKWTQWGNLTGAGVHPTGLGIFTMDTRGATEFSRGGSELSRNF